MNPGDAITTFPCAAYPNVVSLKKMKQVIRPRRVKF